MRTSTIKTVYFCIKQGDTGRALTILEGQIKEALFQDFLKEAAEITPEVEPPAPEPPQEKDPEPPAREPEQAAAPDWVENPTRIHRQRFWVAIKKYRQANGLKSVADAAEHMGLGRLSLGPLMRKTGPNVMNNKHSKTLARHLGPDVLAKPGEY